MKNLLITILLFSITESIAQSTLSGVVLDKEMNEPVSNISVKLFENGTLILEEETDAAGKFIFSDLEAGVVELEFSSLEYQTLRMVSIKVVEEAEVKLKVRLEIGISLDKIFASVTQKTIRKMDRKLRKYVKGLPKKGWKKLKKKTKEKGKSMGRKRS